MTKLAESLVVYTTANKAYEPFVLPYMAGFLESNPGVYVEVGVEDADVFRSENQQAFELLRSRYGPSMDVTTADFSVGAPHSARFLNESQMKREFLYIGDIDIFILQEIMPQHLKIMKGLNLPYSNIIRKGRQALSGLHFTRTDAFYPIENIDGKIVNFDEAMLYQMILLKGHNLPPEDFQERPSHGFHMSLNRRPAGTRNLDWTLYKIYVPHFLEFTQSEFFRNLFSYFAKPYQNIFALMDMVAEAKYPDKYSEYDRSWLNASLLFSD